MLKRIMQVVVGSLCSVALLANAGCSNCAEGSVCATKSCAKPCAKPCKVACKTACKTEKCVKPAGEVSAELPPNAKPGECYAKVWIPPEFKTVTERVLVKEASEQLTIIPAEYEWVEERVCVKEASSRLVEEPAEFATRDVTVLVEPAHTDWIVTKDCEPPALRTVSTNDGDKRHGQQPTRDVFCLVNHGPRHETLTVQCQKKPPTVREEIVAAEYQTVRRQRLARAATTKKTCIPAEYQTVSKTIKVCDGRMAWQRVKCEDIESKAANAGPQQKTVMQVVRR